MISAPASPRIRFDPSLSPEQTLHRYISFESFVAFVENGRTSLTKVISWEDTWEAILSRVPAGYERGVARAPSYSYVEDLFGQCWSLLPESDAMWRIYSPNKTGVVISTSVERFRLLDAEHHLYLGRIHYFEDIQDLLGRWEKMRHQQFAETLLKRSAFKHEEEVRLLLLTNPRERIERTAKAVTLKLDASEFLESVTIDPRAPDWFVSAMELYCRRAGLSCLPVRSRLYEPEPHNSVGLTRSWVPVESPREGKDSGSS